MNETTPTGRGRGLWQSIRELGMAMADRILRPFAKNGIGSGAATQHDADAFITRRRKNMSHLSKQDIDAMSDEALAKADPKQTLREVEALRERMKVRPDPSARNMPD